MLVLSRRVGEEIHIGDNIRVRVVAVNGNQVRLAFVAPRGVPIQREELLTPDPDPRPDAVIEASLS